MRTALEHLSRCTLDKIRYLENDDVESTLSTSGIRLRKVFSAILRIVYKTQSEYKLIVDKREPLHQDGKGKIFIVNHRQRIG